MEDMLPETDIDSAAADETAAMARGLGELLKEHKGADVLVMDVRRQCDWTDYFVIATVSSSAHLEGLERHIREFCRGNNIEILRKSRKLAAENDEWRLIDLGRAVVHLMSKQAREFYELERLWSLPQTRNTHSSKSS